MLIGMDSCNLKLVLFHKLLYINLDRSLRSFEICRLRMQARDFLYAGKCRKENLYIYTEISYCGFTISSG